MFAGCFAAASNDAAGTGARSSPGNPTNFDYLVLASIADSPRLFAMAGYRSTASSPGEPAPQTKPAD